MHWRLVGQRAPGPATAPATAPFVVVLIRWPAACPVPIATDWPRRVIVGSGPHPLIRFGEFMAKKTRKQKQRAAVRRAPAPGAGARQASPAPAPLARPVAARAVPEAAVSTPDEDVDVAAEPDRSGADAGADAADYGSRRRIQRINPSVAPRPIRAQTRTTASAAALFQPLDSEDAAIPFDRVPYVPRDLRRVAIIASLMIVLILIAAFVVTRINP